MRAMATPEGDPRRLWLFGRDDDLTNWKQDSTGERWAMTVDLDADRAKGTGDPDLDPPALRVLMAEALPGVQWAAHTTRSSSADCWRWRVVVPLSQPVKSGHNGDGDEYRAVAGVVRAALAGTGSKAGEADLTWCQSHRGWFMPGAIEHYAHASEEGEPLNPAPAVDAFHAGADVWADAGPTPAEEPSNQEDAPPPDDREERAPPHGDAPAAGEADPTARARAKISGLLRSVPPVWMEVDPPERRYLLDWVDGETGEAEGLFPRGRVGLLAAPGGVGKSFALIDLAVAIATGGDWLGAFPVGAHAAGRVLLAMGEEDEEEIRRRLWAAMKAHDLPPDARKAVAARVVVLPLAGELCALTCEEREGNDSRTPFADALEAELQEAVADEEDGWAALLLDPVSRFAGADAEKDNNAATRFVQALEHLTRLRGRPSILAAVHTNKGSREPGAAGATNAEAVRGSSAFVDGARWVAAMSPAVGEDGKTADPDRVWVGVAKSNYGKRPGVPWLVRREAGGALVAVGPEERAEQLAEERAHANASGGAPSDRNRNERAENGKINALTNRAAELRRLMQDLRKMGNDALSSAIPRISSQLDATLAEMAKEHGKGRPRRAAPKPVSGAGMDV